MMNVRLINKGTTGELFFIGRLDSNGADQVEKIVLDVSDRFINLILDLSEMEYTSSAGLRIILRLLLKMDKKGGSLAIRGASTSVMELFELSGFSSMLNFVPVEKPEEEKKKR